MEAKVIDVLQDLEGLSADDKLSSLTEVKLILSTMGDNEIKSIQEKIDMSQLFQLLSDSSVGGLAYDILEVLLQRIEPIDAFKKYESQLLAGLKHSNDSVKRLCCVQLQRILTAQPDLILNESEFLECIIDCVCGYTDNVSDVHIFASKLLLAVGSREDGQNVIFSSSSSVYKHLRNCLLRENSTVWFRLMQVITDCCIHSESALMLCVKNSLLAMLFDKLKDTTDVLSQAVAIETITGLACCNHGYKCLKDHDIFSYLLKELNTTPEQNPFCTLTQPLILKFFSMAASTYPFKVYEDSLSFYQRLGELVVDHTSSFLPNAVDCLSIIASSVSGKQVLQKAGIMGKILRRLGSLAKDGNSELKATALNTIAALLGVEEGSNSEMKNLNEEICEEWFYELDAQPLEFLQKIAVKPFKDQRLAVLKIFIGLASQTWAQKMMRDHPTFCEYLLDRSTEKDIEGLELKYQIITTLTSSHTSQQIFSAPYLIKLKVYERQGPVYVQASSQVAVEEA